MKTYFKQLIDPSIIIGVIVLLTVGMILTMIFSAKAKSFKSTYRGNYFIYLFSSLLVFSLVAFLGSSKAIVELIDEFVFYQIIAFSLGILHAYIYRVYFKKFDEESIWLELLFNISIILFCTIPFIIVYTLLKGNLYVYVMASGLLPFLVPQLIYKTFSYAVAIPTKIYSTWQFPSENKYPNPTEDEYRDMLLITFVFPKSVNSNVRTVFRAKTPFRMDFGRLFFHFVNDYNNKNSDAPIELLDENGELQHWVFYLKPEWYSVSKFIDPKYPMYVNKVEENSVVYCQRTLPFKGETWQDEEDYEKTQSKNFDN